MSLINDKIKHWWIWLLAVFAVMGVPMMASSDEPVTSHKTEIAYFALG